MNKHPLDVGADKGWSLVEMMVSMLILVLLAFIITNLVDITSKTTSLAGKNIDVESEVRMVFDRVGLDLSQSVNRPDVDWKLNKVVGNDELGLFALVRGYQGQRTLASVNYRVAPAPADGGDGSAGKLQLDRAAKGLGWDEMTLGVGQNLSLGETWVAPAPADYQLLGDQVFRMELCYLLKDGTLSSEYHNAQKKNNLTATRNPGATDDSSANYQIGSWWTWTIADTSVHYLCVENKAGEAVWKKSSPLENIRSLVVGMALLDRKTRVLLSKDQLAALAGALPDVKDGEDVLSAWASHTTDYSHLNSIHPLAGQTVRFYQRTFDLP